jgi:putative phosphoesterase
LIVGLISDTHGLLRPEVFAAFEGVEMILHAGDVGGDDVLDELAVIAPVHAVAGNTDPPGNHRTPESIDIVIAGISVHVSHGHELRAPTLARLSSAYAADVVVYGHTHRQRIDRVGDRWIVNPGAAGQRRFDLRPSVARMTVVGGKVSIELVELEG